MSLLALLLVLRLKQISDSLGEMFEDNFGGADSFFVSGGTSVIQFRAAVIGELLFTRPDNNEPEEQQDVDCG